MKLPLFNRNAFVDILSNEISDFIIKDVRMKFNIQKTITGEHNSSTIEIYNLSERTRKKIVRDDKQAEIHVGYNGEYSLVSRGDIFSVKHSFDRPDIITRLELLDGKTTAESRLETAFSFEKGISIKDAAKKIVKSFNINLDDLSLSNLSDKFMSGGLNLAGTAGEIFDEIADELDADWSLQDDILQFVKKGGSLSQQPIYLSDTSGMIGIPERVDDINTSTGMLKKSKRSKKEPEPGYIVNSLLNPKIRPGSLVNIYSAKQKINGNYIVHTVRHSGDTHGTEWITQVRVEAK